MSEERIIQNMISRLGQSQRDRSAGELDVHFVDIDERTPKDRLLFATRLASLIRYYHLKDGLVEEDGDWTPFFHLDDETASQVLEAEGGTTPAHLALFGAFAKLFENPRKVMNGITGRHMEFFYRRVLRFVRRPPVSDTAHLLIELKKWAGPTSIHPDHRFSAGKDGTGVELIYAPKRPTIVSRAKVDSLRSVFVEKSGSGVIRCAPEANSSDGLGGKLEGAQPKWRAFGHVGLPAAEIGFAVASPILRLREGVRTIRLFLKLGNLDSAKLPQSAWEGAFEAYLTGEESWIEVDRLSASVAGSMLTLRLSLPEDVQAVVDYDAAIHGYAYSAQAPIMQFLLREGAAVRCGDLDDVTVVSARMEVVVSGVTSLTLENDTGKLNPKKAFLPFGSRPVAGSRFMVGCNEALSKRLSSLKLTLGWLDAPEDFADRYVHYGKPDVDNAYFTCSASFVDGSGAKRTSTGLELFDLDDAGRATLILESKPSAIKAVITTRGKIRVLQSLRTAWAAKAQRVLTSKSRRYKVFRSAPPPERPGFITLKLDHSFLHDVYRKVTMKNALERPTPVVVLDEPYTPTVSEVSLFYEAGTDTVPIEDPSLDAFAHPDVQFFHVGCFGQMREHGYQRKSVDWIHDQRVTLVPSYPDEGECIIGLADIEPGDSVTLLFQLAEGSADPDALPRDIRWFVLCDNYWKAMEKEAVVHDTTNHLLKSGVISFVLPAEADTHNTILPAGSIWLKAAIAENVGAVCQFIEVAANAIEVQFRDSGNDPAHLATALPADRIAKIKTPVATVKSVKQPYASFGGSPAETDKALYCRAAERLRHRGRCVTAWDYERSILEAFPSVHRVKCIPHANAGAWIAPGCVLIVVIPDLRNQNAVDRLQPRVDANTLSLISAHVKSRAGMQVDVVVRNAAVQRILLDFVVRFHVGREFNYHSAMLNRELVGFLSPWAFDSNRRVSFGGRVYKSVLLNFVEEREYVDYVTDFKMFTYVTDKDKSVDVSEARVERPDAILVSSEEHKIVEAT